MMKFKIIGVLVALAVLAGGGAYIRWQSAELKTTREERDIALANNKALKKKAAAENEISKTLEERHAIIDKYTPDQDGAVAPVLRDMFDRMHARQTER